MFLNFNETLKETAVPHSIDSRFHLRRAVATDNTSLAQLNQRTFLETYIDEFAIPVAHEDIQSHFHHTINPDVFTQKIADVRQATWVVEDRITGELLAFANVGPCFLPHPDVCLGEDGEIDRIYVRRDRQGCGLGQYLMNVVLSWFIEQFPERPIWLGVWAGNSKARKFYERNRFKTVADRHYNVGEYTFDSVIMRREGSVE